MLFINNFFLTILLLSTSLTSMADVIFVDVNNSESEIIAAKKAAKSRGEKLLIIPDEKYSGNLKSQLNLLLQDMNKNDQHISSVVFSGHYNGVKYFSEDHKFEISAVDIRDVFTQQEFKRLRSEVNNLLLWGCYSGRPKSLNFWENLFPNMQVLTGFSFAAPSSKTVAGPGLMNDVLQSFSDTASSAELESSIDRITNTFLFKITSAVIYDRICYYGAGVEEFKVVTSSECPDSLIKSLVKRKSRMYDKYLKAFNKSDQSIGNVPQNIKQTACHHHADALGRFCIDAQRYSACFTPVNKLPTEKDVLWLCSKYHCQF